MSLPDKFKVPGRPNRPYSPAALAWAVEYILSDIALIEDKDERSEAFRIAMDGLGVVDNALKRELWLSMKRDPYVALSEPASELALWGTTAAVAKVAGYGRAGDLFKRTKD